jgi:hypothetical protein
VKYIDALKAGREIVVIAKDTACDSAIFHLDKNETLYTYTVNMGIFPRNKTEYSFDALEKHFNEMEKEGGYIFIRGTAYNDK